jgi:succinate dehydrogenase/fumarate reductase-like Fe-S protein
MTRGYRGFLREFTRTGSWRALSLQLRTGAAHVLRQALASRRGDPVAQFLAHYGPDGVRAPDAAARAVQLDASKCLVCGLCTLECARVGGAPPLDPREAVIAASRLEIDLLREGLARELAAAAAAGPCGSCDACGRVCPADVPIARVQQRLATLS